MREHVSWEQDGVRHENEPPDCPNCKKMQQGVRRLVDELDRVRQLTRMYAPI